jgi:hypothetical protein
MKKNVKLIGITLIVVLLGGICYLYAIRNGSKFNTPQECAQAFLKAYEKRDYDTLINRIYHPFNVNDLIKKSKCSKKELIAKLKARPLNQERVTIISKAISNGFEEIYDTITRQEVPDIVTDITKGYIYRHNSHYFYVVKSNGDFYVMGPYSWGGKDKD